MARVAAEDGVRTIVATPHVSDAYPNDPFELDDRVAEVNAAIAAAGVELEVVRGAEVAISMLATLDRPALEAAAIGAGRYVLVEFPAAFAPPSAERLLSDLDAEGFRPVLAHTERSAVFAQHPQRLEAVLAAGAVSCVTATSIAGLFGSAVRGVTRRL